MKHGPVTLALALFLASTIATFAATCTGQEPCKACRDCSRCAYCTSGKGSCGTCRNHDAAQIAARDKKRLAKK